MSRGRKKRQLAKETPQQIARTRKRHLWMLVVFAIAVYLSAVPGDFVWTDREDILQGQHRITNLSDIKHAITLPREQYRARYDGITESLNYGTWQPVAILSNSVSWQLWGKCSKCWHAENILLHVLIVVGLYLLGRHILSQARHGNTIAFWAALIFAVHPAGVNNVAWIGGRPELLAYAFGLWALLAFTQMQPTTKAYRNHHLRWHLAVLLLSPLAMLAHEVAYLLPLAALLIASFGAKQQSRGAFRGISPMRWEGILVFTAILIGILIYRKLFVGGLNFAGDYPTERFFDNLGTGLRHLWYFIEQTLLPSEPLVSDAWALSTGWGAAEVAALLGTLLLFVGVLLGFRLGHPAAFGLAWFLLWILPGSGLFPDERYHNDLHLYVAAWGLLLIIAYALFRAWRPIGRQLVPGAEAIMFGPIIIVLIAVTGLSNARWWHQGSLFEAEIANDPLYIEGRLELAESALRNRRPADALNHLFNALESTEQKTHTGYWDPVATYRLMGRVQISMALYRDAERSLKKALDARKHSAVSWHLLGITQLEQGEYQEALESIQNALLISDANPDIEADEGVAFVHLQRSQLGRKHLEKAFERGARSNYQRHLAMSLALMETGEFDAARTHIQKALLRRDTATAHAAMAWALWNSNDHGQAEQELEAAAKLMKGESAYFDWVDKKISQARLSSQR